MNRYCKCLNKMGCCCFNTLRGAAFFVSSIQIYNGLECMLKFIAFPMVFSTMHAPKDTGETTSFISFMPGMVYSILYFLLGCAIFRGIEQECARTIKWGAVCFAITEVSFFILRQIFKVTPTPKVPHLKDDEQPFEMNIYKVLYYFLFTIVGGLIYVCILFLYLQQLSKGQDEFAQFFNITARPPWATPTPTTTTQPAQPPSEGQGQGPQGQGPQGQGQGQGQGQPSQSLNAPNPRDRELSPLPNNHNNNLSSALQHPPPGSGRKHGQSRKSKQAPGQEELQLQLAPISQNGHERNPRKHRSQHPPTQQEVMSPPPPMDPGLPGSPSSPMFPYFLMRRPSKGQGGQGGQGQAPLQGHILAQAPQGQGGHFPVQRGPPPPPPCMMEEPPIWHRPQPDPFGPLEPPIHPPGRNLLSPSRLVSSMNMNVNVMSMSHPTPSQFPPVVPPFYDEERDRRESYGGFSSPHFSQQSYASSRQESHYQKVTGGAGPFDYCLR